MVVLLGTLTVVAPRGLSSDEIANASVGALSILLNVDSSMINANAVASRRMSIAGISQRRLGDALIAWSVIWHLSTLAEDVLSITAKMVGFSKNTSVFKAGLIDELVAQGGNRKDFEAQIEVSEVSVPVPVRIYGPPIANACGDNFCPFPSVASEGAPIDVCAKVLDCPSAVSACCSSPAKTESSQDSTLSSASFLAAGLIPVGILLSSSAYCVRRRYRRKQKTKFEENPDHLSKQAFELKIHREMLADIAGDWRLYHEGTLLCVIQLASDGSAVYNGFGNKQDVRATATGIKRDDGWWMDLRASDMDHLEWKSADNLLAATWFRCRGIAGFIMYDWVELFDASDCEVVAGTLGTVVGFTGDHVLVQFPSSADPIEVLPSQLTLWKGVQTPREAGLEQSPENTAPPSLEMCMQYKRLDKYANHIARENTALSNQNTDLRREFTLKYGEPANNSECVTSTGTSPISPQTRFTDYYLAKDLNLYFDTDDVVHI